jgi:PAS domain S-box-containing protein
VNRFFKSKAALVREIQALRQELNRFQGSETAPRHQEQIYRRLVKNAPVAMAIHSQGKYVIANQSAVELAGLENPDAMIGLPVVDFIHPDYKDLALERIRQTQENHLEAGPSVQKFISVKGHTTEIIVSSIPIQFQGQSSTLAIYHDISQRVTQEQEERSQRQLAEALRDTAAVLNSTLELSEVMRRILSNVSRVVPHDAANIMLIESGVARIVGHTGYGELGLDEAVLAVRYMVSKTANLAQMFESGEGLVIPDVHQYPGWVMADHTQWIRSNAGAPIRYQNEVIGFLNLDSAAPDFYDDEHISRLQAFADQAAVAIQNARLYEAEQRRRKVAEILHQSASVINSTLELDEVLELILKQLGAVITFDTAAVQLLEGDHLRIVACQGFENPDKVQGLLFPLDPRFPNLRVVEERAPLAISGIAQEYSHFQDDAEVYESGHIRAWLGVPLLVKDRVIGMISIDRREMVEFTQEDIDLAMTMANQSALAIENAHLHRSTLERARRLELIAQASHRTTMILNLEDLLSQAVHLINESFDYYLTAIAIIEGDNLVLKATSLPSLDPPYMESPLEIGERGITGWVAAHGEMLLVQDVLTDPRYLHLNGADKTRSELAVPLIFGDEIIGVLDVESEHVGAFTELDVATIQIVADQLAIAIHNARLYEQVQEHAADLEERVKERTTELQSAMAKLEDLDRLKSKFIADISHELRTPLTNMIVYLDLLENASGEKEQTYHSVLKQQSARLVTLVEEILDITHLELGNARPSFSDIDFNGLIRQVVATYLPRAEGIGLELVFEPDDSIKRIWAEPNQLSRVAGNLIANALNYSTEGRVIVRTERDQANNRFALVVTDQGMGIHPDDLPHIFERFYRGQQVSQSAIPGTGLGLAVVKEIVDMHKGSIEIDTKLGKGTTMRVWFPDHRTLVRMATSE